MPGTALPPSTSHDRDSSPDPPSDPPSDPPRRPPLARRAFLTGAALAAGAPLAAPSVAIAAGKRVVSSGAPSQRISRMVGVCVVTSNAGGVYGDTQQVVDRLVELGVQTVRSRVFMNNKAQIIGLRTYEEAGLKLNAVMGEPTFDGGTPEELVDLVGRRYGGMVTSLEGANEWNLRGGATWAPELREHQTRLWAAARADSRTAHLPVLAPALGKRQGYDQLGNITRLCTLGNIHLYGGGSIPGFRVDETLAKQSIVSGVKPVHVTETGWTNAMRSTATHFPTMPSVAGIYAPRLFLEYAVRNVPRVYLFQLLDDKDDPTMTQHEAHFGLLTHDFTPKPVFHAMRNFLALLDRPGSAPTKAPAPLGFTLDASPSDLATYLVRRNDGAYVMFLWRRVSIYSNKDRTRLPSDTQGVRLTFDRSVTVQVHRPSISEAAERTRTDVRTVELGLGAQLTALVIR